MSEPRVIVTIEARLAATRLPGKVMFPIAGEPMLERLVERVRRSGRSHDVIVATTISPPDEAIVDLCRHIGCRVHRGSVEDISQRLLEASSGAELIVQITGDCPLIDPEHIDETVRLLLENNADYASNNLDGCSFPLGFDVRAFTVAALERSITLSDDPTDRVHGSYFFIRRRDLFRCVGWEAPQELRWPELRLTVDEPADYQLVRRVFETLYSVRPDFSARDVIALLRQRPDWVRLNSDVRQKLAAEG